MNKIHFQELGSTNDEAMHGNYPHNTIITTERQTSGRGQRGNVWESAPGENLTFSLVLEPRHIPVVEQYRISMMAALAASDAIRTMGVDCCIKWSNDLYVGDCKIGGILIEHSLMGEMLTKSVIGIGVNVRQRNFSPSLPNPTSMSIEGVVSSSPEDLLEIFAVKFTERYVQSSERLYGDYMQRLWRADGYHRFSDVGGEFEARIIQVDPLTGRLSLRDSCGGLREYWFKEVEFLL